MYTFEEVYGFAAVGWRSLNLATNWGRWYHESLCLKLMSQRTLALLDGLESRPSDRKMQPENGKLRHPEAQEFADSARVRLETT